MAEQLSFEIIGTYTDKATKGLQTTTVASAELRAELAKLAATTQGPPPAAGIQSYTKALTDAKGAVVAYGTATAAQKAASASFLSSLEGSKKGLGDLGRFGGVAQKALQDFAQQGLGPLGSAIPGTNSAIAKLSNLLTGFPLAVGSIIGVGVGLILLLKSWQTEATQTLNSVTAMADGIASSFRAMQHEIAAIRAQAAGDAEASAEETFQAVKSRAEDEVKAKIKAAKEASDELIRIDKLTNDVIYSQTGVNADKVLAFVTGRAGKEAKIKGQLAVDTEAANEKVLTAAAQRDAALVALDKQRVASTLQATQAQKDAELEVTKIALESSYNRIGAIDAELKKAIQAAEAKKKLAQQQLGPGVAATDPRMVQAAVEAEAAITVAKAQAVAQRKALAEAQTTEEIRLTNEAKAQAIAGQQEIAAAHAARVAAAQEAAGDIIGAEETRSAAVQQSYQADLAAFTQAQQAAAAEYARTAEQRFGKSAETDALIAQNNAKTNDAIAAKEAATAEKIRGEQEALAEKIKKLYEERAAKALEMVNRVAEAENKVLSARERSKDAALMGEAQVKAARLKAAGDAKAAEEVLGKARIAQIERAIAAEERKAKVAIEAIQRQIAAQQKIANDDSKTEDQRKEAQTKIIEMQAEIQAKEEDVNAARAAGTAEIEQQKIAMEELEKSSQKVESSASAVAKAQADTAAQTSQLNAVYAAHAAAVASAIGRINEAATNYHAVVKQTQDTLAGLHQQLADGQKRYKESVEQSKQALIGLQASLADIAQQQADLQFGGTFGFLVKENPQLGAQAKSLQNAIVAASGESRIQAKKALDAFLEANKDQIDADRAAFQIEQERAAMEKARMELDKKRNDILDQINAEQKKQVEMALQFEKDQNAIYKAIRAAYDQQAAAFKTLALAIWDLKHTTVIVGGHSKGGIIRAQGGTIVPGSGRGDIVPALLEPGEMVLPRDVTRALLSTANRVPRQRRYQHGGVVGVGRGAMAVTVNVGSVNNREQIREVARAVTTALRDGHRRRGGSS